VIQKLIGQGRYGSCYMAHDNEKKEKPVAVKVTVQEPIYKNREYQILKELNHPNLVQLQGAF